MAGRVHQINVSDGGVPKLPVPSAHLLAAGVEGDTQADRIHHGGPGQTVCLYSLEVIHALQAEGHPIQAGSAGENLTLAGLEWTEVVPGVRLRVGEAALEITFPTTPCFKNAQWFVGGRFDRMHQSKHPGWSRMYARVIDEAEVMVGDRVTIES